MVVYRASTTPPLPRPAAVAVGISTASISATGRSSNAFARRPGTRTALPRPDLRSPSGTGPGPDVRRMIDTPEGRLARFRETCADAVVVTSFDPAFARLACRDFVDRVLRDKLGAREVVVGAGFRFGRNRRGGTALLKELGRRAACRSTSCLRPGWTGASSARRPSGACSSGAGSTRRPVFSAGPTRSAAGSSAANSGPAPGLPDGQLETASEIPARGRFHHRDRPRPARPPVPDEHRHQPDLRAPSSQRRNAPRRLPGSLYGVEWPSAFLRKLRPTRTFPNAEALAARIRKDCEEARAWFGARH